MNLNIMIKPKNEKEIYYFQLVKIVKRFLYKLIEKQKKHCNLNLTNPEKHFLSIHQFQKKDPG